MCVTTGICVVAMTKLTSFVNVSQHDLSALDMALEFKLTDICKILEDNGASDNLGKFNKKKKRTKGADCKIS